MAKYKVLSTKKLEPSLLEQAREKDIDISEQEFISVKPILSKEKLDEVMPWIMSQDVHYVALTSASAVEALKNYLKQGATWYVPNWNIFSLSGKTKDALQPFFNKERVFAIAKNAKMLAEEISKHKVKEVVFFCGNKRRNELPAILRNAGITVHEVIVYKTVETPVAAIDAIDGILFFSPSAVKSFFSVNQLKQDSICFAIGQTTADSIADYCKNKIIISEFPSQETLLASVNFYFQNKACYE